MGIAFLSIIGLVIVFLLDRIFMILRRLLLSIEYMIQCENEKRNRE